MIVETVVAAARAAAWQRWVDLDRWPEWNMLCVTASGRGELAPGCRLDLHLRHPSGRPFYTRPEVVEFAPEEAITWRAAAPGLRSDTRTTFEPVAEGTRVTIATDARGVLAFTYRLMMTPRTESGLYGGMLMSLQGSFAP